MVTDVASIREYRVRFPITWGIAFVLVVVMVLDVLGKAVTGVNTWSPMVGIGQGVPLSDESYRMVTYAFFHTSWVHLATNVAAILVMGAWTENCLPRLWYLGLWVSGVLGAGFAVWVWQSGTAVGASGFAFALVGMGVIFFVRDRTIIEPPVRSFMAGVCIVGWPLTFLVPFVSISGHVGGFVAGLFFGGLYQLFGPSHKDQDRIAA